MNEDFLKKKQEKLGLPLEELRAKWVEFEESGKAIGFTGTNLDEHVRFRINKFFLKLEREPVLEGKFQPLMVDKSDFGVIKQYQKCTEAFNKDPEQAIRDGLCNADGLPIQQSGFAKGKVIDLDKAFTINYDGFFIQKGTSDKIKAKFRLSGPDISLIKFELGNVYEIKGIKSQKAQADGSTLIVGKSDYIPKLFVEREYTDIKADIAEYFQGKIVSIPKAREFYKMCMDNGDKYPLAVVKGNIYNMAILNDKTEGSVTFETNNRIELMAEDENFEIHTIGGWVPKVAELKFNFSENSQNVIVIGSIKEREDKNTKQLVMEFSKVFGIYVPKEFKKSEDQKDIEDTEEVTEQEVKAFINQTLL